MEGILYKIIVCLAIFMIPFGYSLGNDSWQLNRLFHPQEKDLINEAQGQVFIYDGIFNDQVNLAMDQEFARIEHMMFIRTKHMQPSGEVVEENDCD
ncbi:MAG: hypothetical protein QNJ56_08400 [Gammaproteobacteria bacterium]|nr:hypothetical protein [Gammaproteobacteria bacterium]